MEIEWRGHVVGDLEDIQQETISLPISKLHGRWVLRPTREAREFSRTSEEHFHVEVSIRGASPVRGEKVLFSLGLEGDAWLLFYVYDKDEHLKGMIELAKPSEYPQASEDIER